MIIWHVCYNNSYSVIFVILGGGSSYGGQGIDIGGDYGIVSKGLDGDSSEFSSSRERIVHSSKMKVSSESPPKERKQMLSTGIR